MTPAPDAAFEHWLDQQLHYSAATIQHSISAVGLVKQRPGFGQTVRPARGSIIASPVMGAYDPDPDYFYHWFRDAAVVIESLRMAADLGLIVEEATQHFADFIRFSIATQKLDGRDAGVQDRQSKTSPAFRKFLRDESDLAAVQGDRVVAESRINPDGTLDLTTWARPQHDGPALRALSLLRWVCSRGIAADLQADVATLIRADLAFVRHHGQEPSFDIWEEDRGRHYYTLRVAAAALGEGAKWLDAQGDKAQASDDREMTQTLLAALDDYWIENAGHYRSRFVNPEIDTQKALDISVILATVHAGGQGARHSVDDPRMQATLARLDAVFDVRYAINHLREPGRGPALGRYAADRYYDGGAWYVATLGAAEFCFHAAVNAAEAAGWMARGDAYLATVRVFTPADGSLSEQFDPTTGAPLSAKHLAWSYAAFISCIAARRRAAGQR